MSGPEFRALQISLGGITNQRLLYSVRAFQRARSHTVVNMPETDTQKSASSGVNHSKLSVGLVYR